MPRSVGTNDQCGMRSSIAPTSISTARRAVSLVRIISIGIPSVQVPIRGAQPMIGICLVAAVEYDQPAPDLVARFGQWRAVLFQFPHIHLSDQSVIGFLAGFRIQRGHSHC